MKYNIRLLELSFDISTRHSIDMEWQSLLRDQQWDFCLRLAHGHLLCYESIEECRSNKNTVEQRNSSELIIISGEKLECIRDFCWEMAEKYKFKCSVRESFINNMKGKLAEEAVKSYLGKFVTSVDYERKVGGDDKVDLRFAFCHNIGIQVKARCGTQESVEWKISQEEAKRNAVLVCVLIQENVKESASSYSLIMAGFLPTSVIDTSNGEKSMLIHNLLYIGGLETYLKDLDFRYNNKSVTGLQNHAYSKNKLEILIANRLILDSIWEEVLICIKPFATQALLKRKCYLMSFDGQVGVISTTSRVLITLIEKKWPDIQCAFKIVAGSHVEIKLTHLEAEKEETSFIPSIPCPILVNSGTQEYFTG